ncbi:MAG TPA: GAF domain-containing protein, partial [Anaerolineales bacterium]|nr:GAF domain-containing protein [Anaerolineales bacterium]
MERILNENQQKFQDMVDAALSILHGSSTSSEEEVLQAFGEHLKHIELHGGLAILSQDGKKLRFQDFSQNNSSGQSHEFQSLDGYPSFQQVIQKAEAVFVESAEALAVSVSKQGINPQENVFRSLGALPVVVYPLVDQTRPMGALYIAGEGLSAEDTGYLEVFSRTLSIALANIRLSQPLNQANEETYFSLFENLPIGFFRVKPDGQFLLANSALLNIFGLKDFHGLNVTATKIGALTSVDDHTWVLDELVRTGQVFSRVTEWENEAGERVYLKENITAAFDRQGKLLYHEGSVEDITGQKHTEEKLTRQLDELILLNRVAAAGTSAATIDDFLEQVTQIISQTIYSEHVGVLLYDQLTKNLRVHPSYRGIAKEFHGREFGLGEGVVGEVFLKEKPLRIPDVRDYPSYVVSDPDLRSELCVPIKAGGRVLGVLNAERKKLDGFSDEDEILLTTIAGQMAAVLERAKFVTEVENKANQLSLLNQATLTTSRILEPDELIQLIAKQIMDLFNPDAFSITLFDDQTNEIEIAIAVEEGEIDREKSGVRIPFSQGGLTALLRDTGEVLQIDDLASSPLLVGYKDFASEMRGSWLGIPLVSGRKILGALTVQYYEKKEFEAEQTQFLGSLAAHASIAINNGRLFDDIQTRYHLNNQLAKLSEELNRPQTIQNVIETIGKSSLSLVQADMAAFYLRQEDGAICAWSHHLSSEYTDKVTQGLESVPGFQLLNSQTPILISDIRHLPEESYLRELAEAEGVVSIGLWPLVYEEKTIAALGCYRKEPYAYSEDENDVMMAFARQAAVSLENARLMELERSRRMEAEALYKTTLALTSSLDIDQVLSNILVELYRVIDYYVASLHLLEGDLVRIVAAEGLHIEPQNLIGAVYSADVEFFQSMLESKRPLIIEDLKDYTGGIDFVGGANVRGWIGVPLIVGEKMIGFLAIDSDKVGAFDQTHATQAVAFANQAAIAIETARLFSQTQRRLHVLQSIHTIDQAISSNLDIKITLEVFVEQALNLLDIEAIRVFSYDSDAQMYDLLVQRDLVTNRQKSLGQFYDLGLVQSAISGREIIRNFNNTPDNQFARANVKSYFVAPLITKGQVRGVLEVYSSELFTPGDEWLELLNTLATQAAISIENDELITSLQKSNDELVVAYDRTLEGWAYALELRDRETIGHARRVTELTVKLARMMGFKGTDLANIRRGTLLHDIGKMGLPDSVLLKGGPLTKDEEKLMQTHPQLAYEMLSSIPYLKPALNIPYYHHEKWDGTGYPHGLKGEEIPL